MLRVFTAVNKKARITQTPTVLQMKPQNPCSPRLRLLVYIILQYNVQWSVRGQGLLIQS